MSGTQKTQKQQQQQKQQKQQQKQQQGGFASTSDFGLKTFGREGVPPQLKGGKGKRSGRRHSKQTMRKSARKTQKSWLKQLGFQ